jgi:murein DD-endopeptidase MepM/ murein hydrolase activator NlpD
MKYFEYIILIPCLINFSCISTNNKPFESELAGSYYQVKSGDKLSLIAQKYRISIEEIMEINGIDDVRALRVGQALFLPDPDPIGTRISKLRSRPTQAALKQSRLVNKTQSFTQKIFDFPVKSGTISKPFSSSKKAPYDGIGIRAKLGTKVIAALNGKVIFVGDDQTKFGLVVIIEHKEPYITVYTHLDSATVKIGQVVSKGSPIGAVGRSGGIKIPTLHFQIRVDQRPKDPTHYINNLPTRLK